MASAQSQSPGQNPNPSASIAIPPDAQAQPQPTVQPPPSSDHWADYFRIQKVSNDDDWTRHFRIGAMVGMNIKASFNMNGTVPCQQCGAGVYDDGYMHVDSTGDVGRWHNLLGLQQTVTIRSARRWSCMTRHQFTDQRQRGTKWFGVSGIRHGLWRQSLLSGPCPDRMGFGIRPAAHQHHRQPPHVGDVNQSDNLYF